MGCTLLKEKKKNHPQQSILSVHLLSISAYLALWVAGGLGAHFGCLGGRGMAHDWQVNAMRQPGNHTSGERKVASSPDLHLFSTERWRGRRVGREWRRRWMKERSKSDNVLFGGTACSCTVGCALYCGWYSLKTSSYYCFDHNTTPYWKIQTEISFLFTCIHLVSMLLCWRAKELHKGSGPCHAVSYVCLTFKKSTTRKKKRLQI